MLFFEKNESYLKDLCQMAYNSRKLQGYKQRKSISQMYFIRQALLNNNIHSKTAEKCPIKLL